MSVNMTLWSIEAELANLVDLREEMIANNEDVGPVETAIAEYVQREIKKVDGIRGFLKHCEMMHAAAKAEELTQRMRAEAWKGRMDRLKAICQNIMEVLKVKKLEGATGSLLLKGNGGRPAVVITDASLISEELVQYTGTISGAAWEMMRYALEYYEGDSSIWCNRSDVQMERIPHKGRIAEALSAKCPQCEGIAWEDGIDHDQCESCDGDGKARVPGARLEARGSHISII